MAIKLMGKTKITQNKREALERQLNEIEDQLVAGIKDAISTIFTLDRLHEVMDYCESLSADWEEKTIDITDDDLDDLPDDEEE